MRETILNIVADGVVQSVLYLVLAVLASVVGGFLAKYLHSASDAALAEAVASKASGEAERKAALASLLDTAAGLVEKCVTATNQTLVDDLKRVDKFDKTAQSAAFGATFENVKRLISDEARAAVTEMYGDFNEWLRLSIEAAVFEKKTAAIEIGGVVDA